MSTQTSKGPGRVTIETVGRVGRAMMEFGIFTERARRELRLARNSSNPFFKALHLRGARTAASHAREWLAIAREAHAEA